MKFLTLIVLVGSISSCAISRRTIDPTFFNSEIKYDISIQNPVDLLNKMYTFPQNNYTSINWDRRKDSVRYKITLLETHMDDSCKTSQKTIVKATYQKDVWQIQKIKRMWKTNNSALHFWWSTIECK